MTLKYLLNIIRQRFCKHEWKQTHVDFQDRYIEEYCTKCGKTNILNF